MDPQYNFQSSPTPVSPPSSKYKILFLLFAVFIIGALAGAGLNILSQKNPPQKITQVPQPLPSPLVSPTPTPIIVITPEDSVIQNWSTYSGNNYQFSIQYPNNWFINSTFNSDEFLLELSSIPNSRNPADEEEIVGGYMDILVRNNDKNLSIDDWFSAVNGNTLGRAPGPPSFTNHIIFDFKEGILSSQEVDGPFGMDSEVIYIPNNNKVIEFQLFYPQNREQRFIFKGIFYQIISTFKITE